MGFFNWAAPMFGHFADRWSPEDIETIANWLRPSVSAGGALLDVGGGTGALAKRLAAALDARVTVLDPTPEMLSFVPDDSPVIAVQGSAEAMPFADDSFDAIIVTDAFHHFRDQPGAVEEFARVVRGGGTVIVLELDPRGFVMRAIVLGEKLLGEPGAFFTPDQLCAFMAEHGIAGTCEPLSGVSYRYTGTVDSTQRTS
jgi:ubiquinone/menaquinone biosynthesis C-methylase UbiE